MATLPSGGKPAHTKTAEPGASKTAPGKPAPDWERIELDYRAGIKTLRQIAGENGISHVAINKRAKRDDWGRDLSAKIAAKADELVTKASVTKSVTNAAKASEKQVVDANAVAIADVRLAHRKDIQRKRSIVARLMDELEAQVGQDGVSMLAELGEIMRNPDDNGQDKRNDLYQKIISLPERAKTAKTLAETLRITVDMERQAFGMDAKGTDNTPGSAGYVPPAIRVIHVKPPERLEDDDE
jgi:DNA-binding cell septation regulator SpoVG